VEKSEERRWKRGLGWILVKRGEGRATLRTSKKKPPTPAESVAV